MRTIPTYALYGEPGADPDAEFLHCETIEARARLHDYEIRPHRHENLFQLVFLASGCGTITRADRTDPLITPCVALVPARAIHGYSFSNTVQGLVVTLFQDRYETFFRAAPDAALPAQSELIALTPGTPALAAITGATASLAAEFAGRALGRNAMMQAHLAVALLTVFRARPRSAPTSGAAQAERFRGMVEHGFARNQTVDDYAARLNITPVHLRRLCREHLGQTPLGVLNARRVLEAKQLLAFSFLSVKQIAAATGFDDHAYFSRFFSRETGLAPTAFRATPRTTPAAPAPPPPPAQLGDTPPARSPSRA